MNKKAIRPINRADCKKGRHSFIDGSDNAFPMFIIL